MRKQKSKVLVVFRVRVKGWLVDRIKKSVEMGYIQTTQQRVLGVEIHIRIPITRIHIAGDPESSCTESSGPKLALNIHRITIKPSENMGDIDLTTELINHNVCLPLIAIPKLGARIFRIGIETSFFPRTTGLAGTRSTPEDEDLSFNGDRSQEVFLNLLDGAIVLQPDIGRDFIQTTFFGARPQELPVFRGIALEGELAQLELRAVNAGVFFPHIVVGSGRAGDFNMSGLTEDSLDSSKSNFLRESDHELPVEVTSFTSALELSTNKANPRGQVRKEVMMRNSQKKITPLHKRESRAASVLLIERRLTSQIYSQGA